MKSTWKTYRIGDEAVVKIHLDFCKSRVVAVVLEPPGCTM